MADEFEVPAVDPPDPPPDTRSDARVVGVVLAAGTSTRFGAANKLLASIEDEPIVRLSVRTLLDARTAPVVVVVGYEADRVREALSGLDVRIVANEAYEAGQSTSVRTGVAAAREVDADAVVIALGDMPFVAPDTVNRLIDAHAAGAGDALAAAVDGERGNPVLFDARFFDDFTDVEGDTGGRRILLESDDAALVETGDPGVRRDVDTPDDLDAIR